MGPPSAEKVLRTAIAMGVDDAVLITDRAFAGADTVATAKVLAESIRRAGIAHAGAFDLILAGSESSDGATGQIGPMLAECMTLPHLTEVQKIEAVEEGCLQGLKKSKNGRARARITLPAVLTISYGHNEPRLTTLFSQVAAKKKNIVVHTNRELSLPPETVGLEGSPTMVLDCFEPAKKKNAIFLTGGPKEIAARILALIKEKRGAGNGQRR
jgi:electron transfer flavoprotein beta subunit